MNTTGSEQLTFPWCEYQQALCAPLAPAPPLPMLPKQYRLRIIHIGSGYAKDYYGLDVYPTLAEATASANRTNDESANWYASIEEV